MCDGMSALDLPFEKEEIEAFLLGLESISKRLASTLNKDEQAAIAGSRELMQEIVHSMQHSHHHHHDHSHPHRH